ncbi:MAG TPA: hypothetical protein PK948_11110 [Gemmatimonadales bacterium]|nr:hypothetical protein [Gemmatimonadales bacterium]
MSRRFVLTIVVLVLWAVVLSAQDSAAMLRGMETRLDSLRKVAARADSVRFQYFATDTVRVGGLRIATSAALRPVVEAAAAEAWDSIVARFGAAASEGAPFPVMQFGGPETVLPRSLDRRELARGLAGPLHQAIWRRQDSRIDTWLRGGFPTGLLSEEDLVTIGSQLVRIPARSNRACLDGDASACANSLGLRLGADTLAEWYSPDAWPGLAARMDWPVTGRAAWLRDRCADARALDACHAVLTPTIVLQPVGGSGRQLLVTLALEAGGAGAFGRLTADSGATIEHRLSAASGLPVDTLLFRWSHAVSAALPGSPAPSGMDVLLTLAWSTAVLLLAVRGSRWR